MSLDITLEFQCDDCGKFLSVLQHSHANHLFFVEPCKDCIEKAEEKGFQMGKGSVCKEDFE